MSDNEATRAAKARQQVEDELLAEMELRLAQFKAALPGEDRAGAKDRFVVALSRMVKKLELVCFVGSAMMDARNEGNKWARLLAYVMGLVNQKLLLQNEYLIAENRILRAQLP